MPLLATIGAQTLVVTAGGIVMGNHIGARLGARAARLATIAAAVVFAALGVSLVWDALHPA